MNPAVEPIARAVLYEGYVLYPYRASAVKNRHRWSPGGLAPGGGIGSSLRTECLLVADEAAELSVRVRFLHPLLRAGGGRPPAHEASEREVGLSGALRELAGSRRMPFGYAPAPEPDGDTRRSHDAVDGEVGVSAVQLAGRVWRVAVRVTNLTLLEPGAGRETESLRTLASAHVVLHVRGGAFASLTDPPDDLRLFADRCRNEGVWPVLVGEPGCRDTVLASPIILPDYPRVAPESPGDFFDGTEIDEMLALRVLTLTDAEKGEMAGDPRTRTILERVERLSASALAGLHGAVRSSRAVPAPGDRVRLRPGGRADALDVLLAGRTATVVAVETDFEGGTHLAVTVDDDPGRDLGAAAQAGHRFFFRPEEVERLAEGAS
ncbi:MAG: hypothetical protein C0501_03470 [Isosphaera sp.]|nr:hypothetical protein [Isosphaera sp.]